MKKTNLIIVFMSSIVMCKGMQIQTEDERRVARAAVFYVDSPCGGNRIIPQEDQRPEPNVTTENPHLQQFYQYR